MDKMRVSRILTKFEKKNLVFVVWLDLFTSYSKSNYLFSATRNHFFIHPTSTIGRPNVKAICSNQCQSNHTKILSIEWLMICCCCFFLSMAGLIFIEADFPCCSPMSLNPICYGRCHKTYFLPFIIGSTIC